MGDSEIAVVLVVYSVLFVFFKSLLIMKGT